MPVLFRTSHQPTLYKAPFFSMASAFRLFCLLVQFIVPILFSLFWGMDHSQLQTDREFPRYIPDEIQYFTVFTKTGAYSYPKETAKFYPRITVSKNVDENGLVKTSNIKINLESFPEEVVGFNVIFKFKVLINNWVYGNTDGYGIFTGQFPSGIQKISCRGDLKLEQREPADFRGPLPNDVIPTVYPMNLDNMIKAQSNVSSSYYIEWEDYIAKPKLDSTNTFSAEFQVNVNDINVIHSIPLVSIIENLIIIFLSTYILTTLILSQLQHFVYSTGIFKTYQERFYVPEDKKYK